MIPQSHHQFCVLSKAGVSRKKTYIFYLFQHFLPVRNLRKKVFFVNKPTYCLEHWLLLGYTHSAACGLSIWGEAAETLKAPESIRGTDSFASATFRGQEAFCSSLMLSLPAEKSKCQPRSLALKCKAGPPNREGTGQRERAFPSHLQSG